MRDIQLDYLRKYADYAISLLSNRVKPGYSAKDIEKLAIYLIDKDLEKSAELNDIHHIIKLSKISAKAFYEELSNKFGKKVTNTIIRYMGN